MLQQPYTWRKLKAKVSVKINFSLPAMEGRRQLSPRSDALQLTHLEISFSSKEEWRQPSFTSHWHFALRMSQEATEPILQISNGRKHSPLKKKNTYITIILQCFAVSFSCLSASSIHPWERLPNNSLHCVKSWSRGKCVFTPNKLLIGGGCLREWRCLALHWQHNQLWFPGVVGTDLCPAKDCCPSAVCCLLGWHCVDIAVAVLPTSLWDGARTYLATVHVVLNIHKLYIKEPAIWPT